MNLIYNRPHLFLWLSIPFILLTGLIQGDEDTTINVHDTYFIISDWHLAIFIVGWFAFTGLVYYLLIQANYRPVNWMTITHLICTVDVFIFIWLVVLFDWFKTPDIPRMEGVHRQYAVIFLSMVIVLFGQLIFALNVLITLIFRKKGQIQKKD